MYLIRFYKPSGDTVNGPEFKALYEAQREATKRNHTIYASPNLGVWAVAAKD